MIIVEWVDLGWGLVGFVIEGLVGVGFIVFDEVDLFVEEADVVCFEVLCEYLVCLCCVVVVGLDPFVVVWIVCCYVIFEGVWGEVDFLIVVGVVVHYCCLVRVVVCGVE